MDLIRNPSKERTYERAKTFIRKQFWVLCHRSVLVLFHQYFHDDVVCTDLV